MATVSSKATFEMCDIDITLKKMMCFVARGKTFQLGVSDIYFPFW
jgi:hypothetical protein